MGCCSHGGSPQPIEAIYEIIPQYHLLVARDLKLAALTFWIFDTKETRASNYTKMPESACY